MKNTSSSHPSLDANAADRADDVRKIAATCAECDSAYAAERLPDGSIRLIGRPAGCQCGSTEFEEVSNETTEPMSQAE